MGFEVGFDTPKECVVEFIPEQNFDVEFGGAGPPADPYTGAYDVIPKAITQMLDTKGKSMTDNVTVHPIPYSEVSNPQKGKTVTIGG